MQKLKNKVLVFLLVIAMATMAMPVTAMAQRVPAPITDARTERLIDFITQFGGWFSVFPALGNYDVNSQDSIYAALEFVLSSRVFTHGREGILGYPHYGFVQHKGGQRFRTWEDVPSPGARYEFITSQYVDSVLWSLFGITGFSHGDSAFTPTFGFQYYSGGYYYRALAQGGATPVSIEILALYDNGNGTYSVVFEYLLHEWECCCNDFNPPEPEHMQYNIAVIQPFADTYQLLYWRNDVPRNASIPVRQPTTAVAAYPVADGRVLRFVIGSTTFTDGGTPGILEAPPFIASDRTMVPLRVIIEALGATNLSFTGGVVSFNLMGETITMTIDQPLANMGTPVIIAERTFVPLAFVMQEIGAVARWDSVARAAYVYIE